MATEKVRVITPENGLGLDSLEVNPGDLVGVENSSLKYPSMFLIARAAGRYCLSVGGGSVNFINLSLSQKNRPRDPYTLNISERAICLKNPESFQSIRLPIIDLWNPDGFYSLDHAYSGTEAVVQALRERSNLGFDLYANWIESEVARAGARK